MSKKAIYRKGMHLIIKYKGTGGDLIVGRIESVRTNGIINGVNLFTGGPFSKNAKVLLKRNAICPKSVAMAVLSAANGDRKIARREAINFARILHGTPIPPREEDRIQKVLDAANKLTPSERHELLNRLFSDLMNGSPGARRSRHSNGQNGLTDVVGIT